MLIRKVASKLFLFNLAVIGVVVVASEKEKEEWISNDGTRDQYFSLNLKDSWNLDLGPRDRFNKHSFKNHELIGENGVNYYDPMMECLNAELTVQERLDIKTERARDKKVDRIMYDHEEGNAILVSVKNAMHPLHVKAVQSLAKCVRQVMPHLYECRAMYIEFDLDEDPGLGGNCPTHLSSLVPMFLPEVSKDMQRTLELVFDKAKWMDLVEEDRQDEEMGRNEAIPLPNTVGIRASEHLTYKEFPHLEDHHDGDTAFTMNYAFSDENDYQGGEFYIKSGYYGDNPKTQTIKPEKYDAMVFLGGRYMHGVHEITGGHREMFSNEFWGYPDIPFGTNLWTSIPGSMEEYIRECNKKENGGLEGPCTAPFPDATAHGGTLGELREKHYGEEDEKKPNPERKQLSENHKHKGYAAVAKGLRLFEEKKYAEAAKEFWLSIDEHTESDYDYDLYKVQTSFDHFMDSYAAQNKVAEGLCFVAEQSFLRRQTDMANHFLQKCVEQDPKHNMIKNIREKFHDQVELNRDQSDGKLKKKMKMKPAEKNLPNDPDSFRPESEEPDFLIPKSLEVGEMAPIRWRNSGEQVDGPEDGESYVIGFPPELHQEFLAYIEKNGMMDVARKILYEERELEPGEHRIYTLDDGMKWGAMIQGTWESDMIWLDPADEECFESLLRLLGRGGFDIVLDKVGKKFLLDGLMVQGVGAIFLSDYEKLDNIHMDIYGSKGSFYNVIVPVHIPANDTAPFYVADEDLNVGKTLLNPDMGVVLGGESNHGTGEVNYRKNKDFRLSFAVYVADLNEDNIDLIAADGTSLWPTSGDTAWFWAQRGRLWSKNGGKSLKNDQGRMTFEIKDQHKDCPKRKNECESDPEGVRLECPKTCKLYLEDDEYYALFKNNKLEGSDDNEADERPAPGRRTNTLLSDLEDIKAMLDAALAENKRKGMELQQAQDKLESTENRVRTLEMELNGVTSVFEARFRALEEKLGTTTSTK